MQPSHIHIFTLSLHDALPISTITSATTASVVEGTSTATVVYTAAATDVAGGTVTYSLTGADAAAFNINGATGAVTFVARDRKSTRLNSSHRCISYAVFCLKQK